MLPPADSLPSVLFVDELLDVTSLIEEQVSRVTDHKRLRKTPYDE
jgi:hypothetical protein